MSDLNQFKDDLAKATFGQGLCIKCGKAAIPRCYSAAGRREYRISGLCELCFDAICGGE